MRALFATDGSAHSERALEFLLGLSLGQGDTVHVVCVPVYVLAASPDVESAPIASAMRRRREAALGTAEATAARIRARGIAATAAAPEGPRARTIARIAEELDADLIVTGSRALGILGRTLLGSTVRDLSLIAGRPLLVVRAGRLRPLRILAAIDGSADSGRALAALAALPVPAGADVTLLHVLPLDPLAADLDPAARAEIEAAESANGGALLAAATRTLGDRRVRPLVVRGDRIETILRVARDVDADLIVLGARGISEDGELPQGSVADEILRRAPCAVLVARAAQAAPTPSGAHASTVSG